MICVQDLICCIICCVLGGSCHLLVLDFVIQLLRLIMLSLPFLQIILQRIVFVPQSVLLNLHPYTRVSCCLDIMTNRRPCNFWFRLSI